MNLTVKIVNKKIDFFLMGFFLTILMNAYEKKKLQDSEKIMIESLTLINNFTVSTLRKSPFEIYQSVADFHENRFQQFLRDRKDTRVENNLVDMSKRLLQSVKDQLAHIHDLKTQLEGKLEREKKLNFKYRLGYTTDFYVFLSTFLRITSSKYQSSSRIDKLLKKLPLLTLKMIADYSGVIYDVNEEFISKNKESNT